MYSRTCQCRAISCAAQWKEDSAETWCTWVRIWFKNSRNRFWVRIIKDFHLHLFHVLEHCQKNFFHMFWYFRSYLYSTPFAEVTLTVALYGKKQELKFFDAPEAQTDWGASESKSNLELLKRSREIFWSNSTNHVWLTRVSSLTAICTTVQAEIMILHALF